MKDIDGDGAPELIYGSAGDRLRFAKPDPAKPTGPWISRQVGEAGTYAAHGIGVGDINGDGRVDILERARMVGAAGRRRPTNGRLWTFSPRRRSAHGGAEMASTTSTATG